MLTDLCAIYDYEWSLEMNDQLKWMIIWNDHLKWMVTWNDNHLKWIPCNEYIYICMLS